MKILISPAKSLDYTTALPSNRSSQPRFLPEAEEINAVLKQYTPKELSQLMSISDKLSDLNWIRNQERSFDRATGDALLRPAVYAFNGDVYSGLDAYTLGESRLEVMQEKLRILSGLYGLLRPLDEIEPYRLEMGTKMGVAEHANLYGFWKPRITAALNDEMKTGELLVNLASNEYFSAVNRQQLKAQLVVPEFKELRAGKLKTISFFAKKARGTMVRYILDNEVETVDQLKAFDCDGYVFSESNDKKGTLLFTR